MGVLYSYEMGLNVMAKRVQSEAQKEFKREQERLLRIVRKGEQEGYIFPEDIVPRLPKHVTQQQLDDIKRIHKEDLYEVASFVDRTTGEITQPNRQTRQRKVETKPPRISTSVSSDYISPPRIRKEKTEPLSEAERKARRSEASKKAFQTKKARLKAEGKYDEWAKQQSERLHRAKAEKYPKKTAIDSVTEKIVDLERKSGAISTEEAEQIVEQLSLDNFPTISMRDVEFNGLHREHGWADIEYKEGMKIWQSHKSDLLGTWTHVLERSADNLGELEDYLIANMGKIDEYIYYIEYASTIGSCTTSFASLGALLNQRAMTAEEAKAFSEQQEDMQYNEEDIEELAEAFMW